MSQVSRPARLTWNAKVNSDKTQECRHSEDDEETREQAPLLYTGDERQQQRRAELALIWNGLSIYKINTEQRQMIVRSEEILICPRRRLCVCERRPKCKLRSSDSIDTTDGETSPFCSSLQLHSLQTAGLGKITTRTRPRTPPLRWPSTVSENDVRFLEFELLSCASRTREVLFERWKFLRHRLESSLRFLSLGGSCARENKVKDLL